MARAERGMTAPPEVVFSTATDPARVGAWLPEPLRRADGGRPEDAAPDGLRARWSSGSTPHWSAQLHVVPLDAGGATVRLEVDADRSVPRLAEIADESLARLAREVDDNLTAG
ncbi:hypothetical protein AB0J86_13700 [Micromonospora sp. NPDC049559]|uniref:hypothetical protein n=1 Tax=Micromonospora sp. NPDC049559 TaxID=3155923 RepID=UPI003423A0ED